MATCSVRSTAHRVDIILQWQAYESAVVPDINMLSMFKATPCFVEIYQPLRIDSVAKGTPAAKIGLTPADKILSINGQKVETFNAFTNEMGRIDDQFAVATARQGQRSHPHAQKDVLKANGDIRLPHLFSSMPQRYTRMGFVNYNIVRDYKVTHIRYGFFESFPAASSMAGMCCRAMWAT